MNTPEGNFSIALRTGQYKTEDIIQTLYIAISTDPEFELSRLKLEDAQQATEVAEGLITMLSEELGDILSEDDGQARRLSEANQDLVAHYNFMIQQLQTGGNGQILVAVVDQNKQAYAA